MGLEWILVCLQNGHHGMTNRPRLYINLIVTHSNIVDVLGNRISELFRAGHFWLSLLLLNERGK